MNIRNIIKKQFKYFNDNGGRTGEDLRLSSRVSRFGSIEANFDAACRRLAPYTFIFRWPSGKTLPSTNNQCSEREPNRKITVILEESNIFII